MTNIYKYPDGNYVVQCGYCGLVSESNLFELPINKDLEAMPYVIQCRSGSCRHNNIICSLVDYSNLYAEGYECTDGDNNQYVKKISNTEFMIIDNNRIHEIDIDDYTNLEIREHISGYYSSLEELQEMYGDDSNQVIAECIAEQE